jgi:hypothetical protein
MGAWWSATYDPVMLQIVAGVGGTPVTVANTPLKHTRVSVEIHRPC